LEILSLKVSLKLFFLSHTAALEQASPVLKHLRWTTCWTNWHSSPENSDTAIKLEETAAFFFTACSKCNFYTGNMKAGEFNSFINSIFLISQCLSPQFYRETCDGW